MRFVSFNYIDRFARAGVLLGETVIDLSAAAPLVFEQTEGQRWSCWTCCAARPTAWASRAQSRSPRQCSTSWGVGDADEFGELVAPGRGMSGAIAIGGVEMVLPIDEVRLVAPLPRPNSLRDFYAFEQHVVTANRNRGRDVPYAWYEILVFYFGNHMAIYGPNADIPLPRTQALDYELELACVIGRAGRDIAEEDAEAYIAGYTIMNDWSARDLQREEMAAGLGPATARISLPRWGRGW